MANKLLYCQIIDSLTEKIKNNELLPYQQLPTEMELAQKFNVSRITSRRALVEMEKQGWILRSRGKGSSVKPRTDSPVYLENQSGVQNMISIIIPHQDENQRLLHYILGATDYLATKGYSLSIHTYKGNSDVERELLSTLPKVGVKGIIYYPVNVNANLELINTMYMNEYPLVTIDKYFDIPISYVVSDNFSGGYQVISHLLKLGHSRIAFASRNSLESASSIRNRYFGYCRGLKENGLEIDSEIIAINFSREFSKFTNRADFYKHLVEQFLQKDVTAIQVVNDTSAVQIIKACMEMGVKIPEQLSVTGFDNLEISQHLGIPLTTVAQDFRGIGSKAAEIIVNCLEGGSNLQEQVILPVELITRKSSNTAVSENNNLERLE